MSRLFRFVCFCGCARLINSLMVNETYQCVHKTAFLRHRYPSINLTMTTTDGIVSIIPSVTIHLCSDLLCSSRDIQCSQHTTALATCKYTCLSNATLSTVGCSKEQYTDILDARRLLWTKCLAGQIMYHVAILMVLVYNNQNDGVRRDYEHDYCAGCSAYATCNDASHECMVLLLFFVLLPFVPSLLLPSILPSDNTGNSECLVTDRPLPLGGGLLIESLVGTVLIIYLCYIYARMQDARQQTNNSTGTAQEAVELSAPNNANPQQKQYLHNDQDITILCI
jgi:hypothetical protein